MSKLALFIAVIFLCSCRTTTYFVVRHAEKETANTMVNDVPLSEAGKQRALALKDLLKNEKIKHIYSTNYIRTKSTAAPLSEATGVAEEIYDPRDTNFVTALKIKQDGNVLIVGHSNTVDDIVNKLTGTTAVAGDLADSEYGDLFIVKKRGNKYFFQRKHFGE